MSDTAIPDEVVEAVARAIYLVRSPSGAVWDAVDPQYRETIWKPAAIAALDASPLREVVEALLNLWRAVESYAPDLPGVDEAQAVLAKVVQGELGITLDSGEMLRAALSRARGDA